jgi:hypothetical protein
MAHKNLITDRSIWEQTEIAIHRKSSKCWATKKTRFDKVGAENSRLFEEKENQIRLYIYKCKLCKSYHLTKQKSNIVF